MKVNFKVILATTALIIPAEPFDIISNDVNDLTDLPLNELLSQKKYVSNNDTSELEVMPGPLPLIGGNSDGGINPLEHMQIKGLHRMPIKRGHYEEEEEEEEWLPKGKDKGKINKIFNTSIMALSFLAFGGYLLCLIVNAIKEKNNEMMATAVTPTVQQQLLLQQLLNNRPYPIKLPAGSFTVHQGKRKKRSEKNYFHLRPENASKWDHVDPQIVQKLLDGLIMFGEDIVALHKSNEKFHLDF